MIRWRSPEAKKIFGDRINKDTNHYDILQGADALAIVTEWSEYRNPDFDKLPVSSEDPLIFDGRNLTNPIG